MLSGSSPMGGGGGKGREAWTQWLKQEELEVDKLMEVFYGGS